MTTANSRRITLADALRKAFLATDAEATDLADELGQTLHARDRYRLAWLSARRRAADEANYGMEALDHYRAEIDRLRADVGRLREFAEEVDALRRRCKDGSEESARLDAALRPVNEALDELERAEQRHRPYRRRRLDPEMLEGCCPACDIIPDSTPQPAPCLCGDDEAIMRYWRAEKRREDES
ncbi:hypothetical protein [Streptomyces sp. CAU 1734]|uniref:hypothetical protein n=1 Tax=Streptomyces sp. CAU 1734 TaxID=3140360 RepID=UPI003260D656